MYLFLTSTPYDMLFESLCWNDVQETATRVYFEYDNDGVVKRPLRRTYSGPVRGLRPTLGQKSKVGVCTSISRVQCPIRVDHSWKTGS